MKQAKKLNEILRVTGKNPLTGEDFDNFFVDTDIGRGTEAAKSLADYLQNLSDTPQKILFTGHRGSGKSTELWRLQQRLKEIYLPISFSIYDHLDPLNLSYIDLIFLVMQQTYAIAREQNISIDESLLRDILAWTEEVTKIKIREKKAGVEIEGGASTPKFLSALLAQVKGILQMSTQTKDEIRQKIEPQVSQLILKSNKLLDAVNEGLSRTGKRTLIIVEDLDKITIPTARRIFCENGPILSKINTHIVYTVPIFVLYSRDSTALHASFNHRVILPMIKTKLKNSQEIFAPGRKVVEEILYKRIDKNILPQDVITYIFEKSGGCLDDIFDMLRYGTLKGLRLDKQVFDLDLAEKGKNEAKKVYEMTISPSPEGDIQPEQYFARLKQVHQSKTKKIAADTITLDLLNSRALLEYNDERWCDVHPMVVEMMEEIEII